MEVFEGIMFLVLIIASILDVKYMNLPMWLLIGSLLLGGVSMTRFWSAAEINIIDIVAPLMPGIIFLLIAFTTKQQIGYGDGLVLIAMGGCFGTESIIWILFVALVGTFVCSMILIMCKRANRYSRLPFIPFLLLGNIVIMGRGFI